MSHFTENGNGLCSTCIHSARCTLRGSRAGSPVIECAEFDDGTRPVSSDLPGFGMPPESAGEAQPGLEEEAGRFKGLCRDCVHRQTCTFPKAEGGVWHCEEYR